MSAGYVAAVVNAVKACGTLVRVEPDEFLKIVKLQENPLVVRSVGGLFAVSFKYLTSYRGLAFHCKSSEELRLPAEVELINANKFSMPDL